MREVRAAKVVIDLEANGVRAQVAQIVIHSFSYPYTTDARFQGQER